MKKSVFSALLVLLLVPGMLPGDDTAKVLAMQIPGAGAAAANTLLINISELEALGAELTTALQAADIRLLDPRDRVLATLGRLKKGKLKWDHKTVQDKFLAVSFAAGDYSSLAESVQARRPWPGCRLAACDGDTGAIINSLPVAFCALPDLAVQLNYPVNAQPGEALGQALTVTLENMGSAAARDIRLEIVLSSDDKIPRRSASAAAHFTEDALLEGGRETVPLLEPGQQLTVRFSGSVKLPEDTPPGKHYLAVVADPEDRIGELSKDNNIFSGFIMITVPEPAFFTVEMPETVLNFEPASYGFKIVCADTLLSDGKDWKLCRMKPHVFQIKHVTWTDFYWEIDTYERAVWEVRGADFCKRGGRARDLPIKVEVTGGSLDTLPSRFALKLAQTRMRFEPATKKFALLAYDRPICHLPFWWVCKRDSFLYQIRCALWENRFWQVDTFKKEVSLVTDGKFCSTEGIAAKLPLAVTVEK
jgi:hypothetical protein